ncbi:MAG: hypothetical protein NTX76_01290 [Alphaproteobacteria bacterium]|nr:hypothetical protein [Alphaproteobacteria bacterium]
MKKTSAIIVFLFACLFFTIIYSTKNKPETHPHLLELFSVLGISHDGTVPDITQLCQKLFRRKPGQERWQMEEIYSDKREKLLPILQKLGVLDEIRPFLNQYDTILINGGLVSRMRVRLKFLDEQWAKQVRAKHIVFLVSDRPLDPIKESIEVINNPQNSTIPFRPGWSAAVASVTPKTEADAAKIVWDQIITQPGLRRTKVHYVRAPMIMDEKTQIVKRPGTIDTMNAWLDTKPTPGKYLVISNNPFILYQCQVIKNALKKRGYSGNGAYLEATGPAADKDTPISVHMDNIALWLEAKADEQKE